MMEKFDKHISYFELLDPENNGKIVKSVGRKSYEIVDGEWVRSGNMVDYYMADVYDESPKFPDDYREISEEEAFEKLGLK